MQTVEQVIGSEFLDVRCMLIEIAAMLDRYDRSRDQSTGTATTDHRMDLIYRAISLLSQRDTTADRSERLLNLFSEMP